MLLEIFIIAGLILLALLLFCPIPIRLAFAFSKGEFFWELRLFRKKIVGAADIEENEDLPEEEESVSAEQTVESMTVNAPVEEKDNLKTPDFISDGNLADEDLEETKADYISGDETGKNKKARKNPEKKKLTEREFLTILMEPKFDSRVIALSWRLMKSYIRLFRIHFDRTVVEGIRLDYDQMGILQGMSGVLTANVALFKNWEFHMDWCRKQKLRIDGSLVLSLTWARILGAFFKTLFYAAQIYFLFRKNKKRMIANPGTFRLIFWRRWIVNFMTAEN